MDRQLDEALKVLGIRADSDRATVTSAYRRLARATHPDVSPAPDAAERFATVAAAHRLVSGVPRARPHPGPDAEDGTGPTNAFPGSTAPMSSRGEHEASADDWTSPALDLGGVSLLLRVSPFASVRSWRRPPIVAGPTVVRRAQPGAGEEERR
jgi:DnaJ domain